MANRALTNLAVLYWVPVLIAVSVLPVPGNVPQRADQNSRSGSRRQPTRVNTRPQITVAPIVPPPLPRLYPFPRHPPNNPPPSPTRRSPYHPPPRPITRQPYHPPPRPTKSPPYHPPPRPIKRQPYHPPPRPTKRPPYHPPPRPIKRQPYHPPPRPTIRPPYHPPPRPIKRQPYHPPPRPTKRPQYYPPPRPIKRQRYYPQPKPKKRHPPSVPKPPKVPQRSSKPSHDPQRTNGQIHQRPVFPQPRYSPAATEAVVKEAVQKVQAEDAIMKARLNSGLDKYAEDFNTPDPLLFSESPENAEEFSQQSRLINWMGTLIREKYLGQSVSDLLAHPVASKYKVSCPFKPPAHCNSRQKYRTVDGTCNNLHMPLWGAAFTPFTRYLPPTPSYSQTNGRYDLAQHLALPNPRIVSTTFHESSLSSNDDSIFSMLVTLFGQFLTHDIAERAPSKGINQAILKCCNQNIPTPAGYCANFDVPTRDFFRQYNRDCMEFPRSLEVTDLNCQTGERQQLNQASSFIDGGAIYGATKNKSDSLREFKGGLLMMSVPNHLPIVPHVNTRAQMHGFAFYAAGDNRVNEFVGLIGMETLWVREHNRVAEALAKINSHWDDETLYQETRRIIIAMLQHITYAEYLPAILGPDLFRKYDLQLVSRGYYTHYNSSVNPSLGNAFATAAMRFGHSMLRTTYSLLNIQNNVNGYTPIDLKDTFFRPQTFLVHEDPLMRGMVNESSKKCDRVISGSVINNLYETTEGSGHDLAANNVQRGRDHGLLGYSDWRKYYGLSTPTRFNTSPRGFPDHSTDTVQRLKQLYREVNKVELFTGGISETPVRDGAVGPLFGNILGQQFRALKKGDRHWYETNQKPQALTPAQLIEIRKITMARLLCNTYTIQRIQRRAFYKPGTTENTLTDCSSIQEINLNAWRQ